MPHADKTDATRSTTTRLRSKRRARDVTCRPAAPPKPTSTSASVDTAANRRQANAFRHLRIHHPENSPDRRQTLDAELHAKLVQGTVRRIHIEVMLPPRKLVGSRYRARQRRSRSPACRHGRKNWTRHAPARAATSSSPRTGRVELPPGKVTISGPTARSSRRQRCDGRRGFTIHDWRDIGDVPPMSNVII